MIAHGTYSINKIWRWISPGVGESTENRRRSGILDAQSHLEINLVALDKLGMREARHSVASLVALV